MEVYLYSNGFHVCVKKNEGIHGINVGLSIAWGALLNQALAPYGYTDGESGIIVAIAMAAGAVGARKSYRKKITYLIYMLLTLHFFHICQKKNNTYFQLPRAQCLILPNGINCFSS